MSKQAIKIIKRQAVKQSDAHAEPKKSAAFAHVSPRLTERALKEEIAGWIDERQQQSRLAEAVAGRELLRAQLSRSGRQREQTDEPVKRRC